MAFVMTRWPGVTDGVAVSPAGIITAVVAGAGATVVGAVGAASPGEAMGVRLYRTANVAISTQSRGLDTASASITFDVLQPPATTVGQWRYMVALGPGGERLFGLDMHTTGANLVRNAAQVTIVTETVLVGVPKRWSFYWAKGTTTANGSLRVQALRLDTMVVVLDYALTTTLNVGTVNLASIWWGSEFTSGSVNASSQVDYGNVGYDVAPAAAGDLVTAWPVSFTAPTGLTATPISTSRIDLNWDDTPTATGYDVERDTAVIATGVAVSAYSDTGLSPGTSHDYRVRATKGA